MSMRVALVAEGVISNVTEYHLGTGFKNKYGVPTTYSYPQGQHIRGSIGYELLHVNAELSKSFLDENASLIYFKDAIPLHEDNGLLLPFVAEGKYQNFKCNVCNQVLRYPTKKGTIVQTRLDRKTGRALSFRLEAITRGYRYRFKAALNMRRGEDYAEEFVAIMKLIEENGLKLGRRNGKGKGHFKIAKLDFKMIKTGDIKKRAKELEKKDRLTLHFVSDFVGELTGETIVKGIKNAGRHFHPDYESYEDPFVRVVRREALNPRKVLSLHRKVTDGMGKNVILKDMAIPAGAKVQIEFAEKPPEMFYECLAIAEMVRGIGSKTSFGKGEFVVI